MTVTLLVLGGAVAGFFLGAPFWVLWEHSWHASQPGWLRTTAKKNPDLVDFGRFRPWKKRKTA